MGFLDDLVDIPYKLRYGVPSAEKSRLAVTGGIPGGRPVRNEEDADNEERRASGFLFGKNLPLLARGGVGLANRLRFADRPELHNIARNAVNTSVNENSIEGAAKSGTERLGKFIPRELSQNIIDMIGLGSESLADDEFKGQNISAARRGEDAANVSQPNPMIQALQGVAQLPLMNFAAKHLRRLPFTY